MILLGSTGGRVASKMRCLVVRLTVYLLAFLIVFGPNIALAGNSPVDIGKTSFSSGFKLSPSAFDGSFQYELPLTIPPGRNGLQPSLALSYSSRPSRETNLFGYGWSFSIPYIERKNYTGSESLYSDTAFFSSLSGDLASTSDVTVYKAKVDDGDFLQYTFSSSTGWTVKDKQGTVYTFGSASSTQVVDPNNSAHVYKWMLKEVRDTNDNYISYAYTKDNNQIYPDVINYTGYGTSTGAFDVHFTKELRNDYATSTAEGFTVTTRYRISEIKAEVSDSWVRKYALAYGTGDNGQRDMLTSVTESGYDGVTTSTLPAITYTYQTPTDSWTEAATSTWDLPEPTIGSSYTDVGTRFADVNGDGLPDILHREEGSTNKVYINTGTGWGYDDSWTIPVVLVATSTAVHPGSLLVDINGDGRIDIAQAREGVTSTIYINSGTSWTLTSSTVPVNFSDSSGNDLGVRVAEVDGDGLPDLVHNTAWDGNKVYINNGSTWVYDSSWSLPEETMANTNPDKDIGTRLLDVNGDGLSDVIRKDESVNKVYLHNGATGWTLSSSTVPVEFMNAGNDMGTRFEDINGDGLVDLINSQEINDTGVYLNTGGAWAAIDGSQTIPFKIVDFVSSVYVDPGTRFADVDGDGLVDILQYRSGQSEKVYLRNGLKPDLLATITNQQGGVTTVTYKGSPEYDLSPSLPLVLDTVQKLAYNDGISTWDKEYLYEGGVYDTTSIRDRKFAGFSKVTETDDLGFVTKQYFHQGNATASSTGEYDDHIAKIGKVYRTEVYDSSNNLYAKTINKWDRYDRGDGASFVKLTQSVDFNYDGDSDHKEKADAFTYDNHIGALTEKIQWGQVTGSDDGSFSDTGSDKFTTTLSYATTSTSTMALVKQETTVDQSAAKVRERKIYYDGLTLGSFSKGNPTKDEQWKVSSTYIDTEKTYNSYGLVTQEKDPRDKTTDYTYDALNLYPATTTNALSQTFGRTYDYSSGKVTQLTDPNSRVFQTVYDPLDRVTEEKQPDIASPTSLVTKKSYTYTDTGFPTKVQTTAYLNSGTSTDAYVYFDGFGRKRQERTEAEGSNYVAKDYTYEARGMVATESLPYFSTSTNFTATSSPASAVLVINYTYDPLKRVTIIRNQVGTSTNAYDDWKLTSTDAEGNAKDLSKDAFGNLVEVIEHNGTSTYTTAYEYNGNNKLTKLTDAEANVRNFTYDGLGRRLTAQDLHDAGDSTYGSSTYTYDDSGNMTAMVDPKNQTINYTYDDLNRVLTEDYTGSGGTEVSYAYDTCTEGKGHLCTATSTGAIATYTYNALGLIATETKNISSTAYTTTRAYDRLGNPTTITYPDSSEVKYTYNAAGLLEVVAQKESGGSFADLISNLDYSPIGKISVKEFASGVTSEYTYDPTKLYRLTRILTTPPGVGGFDGFDLGYWDGDHIVYFNVEDSGSSDPVSLTPENIILEETEGPMTTPGEALEGPSAEAQEPPVDETIGPEESPETLPESGEVKGEQIETPEGGEGTVPTIPMPEEAEGVIPEIAEHLKLKAHGADLLGHKERSDGVVKYAHKTNIKIDNVSPSAQTLAGAQNAGADIIGEVLEKRTKHSRTFATDQEGTFVLEVISGDPQYYQDEQGEWWQADYATTTQEAYDLQTRSENKGVLERLIDVISLYLFPRAHADTSTFYPDPNTESSSVDGYAGYQTDANSTWATVHDATSGNYADDYNSTLVVMSKEAPNRNAEFDVARSFVLFDTSALHDSASISSSTFSLYGYATMVNQDNDGQDYVKIFASSPAANTAMVAEDYDQAGSTAQSDTSIDFGSMNLSGYNDFPLNATGVSNISKTGVTKFGIREGHDIENSSINTNTKNQVEFYTADYTGTSRDPKLVVVYTVTLPPTGLLTEGETNPSNILDDTPEFSAIFDDVNATDTAYSYQIQVATSTSFTSVYWDSTKTTLSPTSTPVGGRIPDISYAGSALAVDTIYYWRIKFWDQGDTAGVWSAGTDSFAILSQPDDAIQDINITYDKVGNITAIDDDSESGAAKTLVFGYDDLNRLISASTTAASSSPFGQTYTYSAIGNITNKSDQGSYSYSETGSTNPQAVTTIGSAGLVYDTNGNLTSFASSTYAWDFMNRLISTYSGSATTTYQYDHTTDRVKKTVGASSTIFANDLYNTDGTTKTKHIYLSDELLGTITTVGSTSTKQYIHTDHLGGTNAVTNASGTLIETADYYPFGDQRISIGSNNEQRKFTGHEYDEEADLTYANARYYEQNIGRWTAQDSASRDNPNQFLSDPQQLNYYSYARNNPLVLVDQMGTRAELFIRYVPGTYAGMHMGYRLTPDNPGDPALSLPAGVPQGTKEFTLGAYNRKDVLTKEAGYSGGVSNSDSNAQNSKYYYSTIIPAPSGMTDTEYMNKFSSEFGNIQTGQEYFTLGGTSVLGSNSNNFAYTLGDNVGVGSDVKNFAAGVPGLVPGSGTRLPSGAGVSGMSTSAYQAKLNSIKSQAMKIQRQINKLKK